MHDRLPTRQPAPLQLAAEADQQRAQALGCAADYVAITPGRGSVSACLCARTIPLVKRRDRQLLVLWKRIHCLAPLATTVSSYGVMVTLARMCDSNRHKT
jgi:hypothetical protein